MRRIVPIALAAGLFTQALTHAQDPPVIRVNTRLVEVDVVVHSKGQPVANLTQDHFTVLDRGKPQKIAVFGVRSTRTSPASSTRLVPGAVSNRISPSGQEPAGVTVILFDTLNTPAGDQSFARQQLLAFLRTLDRGDHLALYTLNKTLRVIQDFTDDPDRLIQAARRSSPETSVDEAADGLAEDLLASLSGTGDAIADAMQQNTIKEMQDMARLNRVTITARTLELIARHLEGLPGRKKLVWMSASFPAQYSDRRARNGMTLTEYRQFGNEIEHAVRALNDANVAVYPVDPRGLTPAGLLLPGIDTMNLLAGGTGGRAFYVTNDVAGAIRTAVADSEVTYVLGFYPSDVKLDGSYHNLSVKVARAGLDVRHRRGYYAADLKASAARKGQESLNEIFANPLEATGIALTAIAEPLPRQAGVYRVSLTFNPQDLHLEREKNNWVALVDFAAYFLGESGPNGIHETVKITLTEQRLRECLISGYYFQQTIVAGNRTGDLRLAVRDRATGAAGSVRLRLAKAEQPNPKNGQ